MANLKDSTIEGNLKVAGSISLGGGEVVSSFKCVYDGALKNGQGTSLPKDTYDLWLVVFDAWSNTGGAFLVPTTRITKGFDPGGTDIERVTTYGGASIGAYGHSAKGTSAWVACDYNNTSGYMYITTGYDSTIQTGDYYVRKIYGIKIK